MPLLIDINMYLSHIDISILHMIKFLFKCMSRALAVKNELTVGHRYPLQFPNVAKREQCELYEVLKDTGRVSMFSSQHSMFLRTTFSNRQDQVRVCLADTQFTIQSIGSALNCLVALTPFKSDYSRKYQWCLAVTTRLSSV